MFSSEILNKTGTFNKQNIQGTML
uniref:Uncharacterized protein n=1 Tax=Arundo donax TaxID=35708 RepID=A0A0A9BZQ3_ARUDO